MSLLNIGVSALGANKTALNTISHNIANVNTPGYSRQSVAFESIPGQDRGRGFIGRGVQTSTVLRHYSQMLDRQSNAANATSAADAARLDGLNRMQDIFSGGEEGLGAAINSMMNALADMQSAPTDATARNVALTRMSELAARFRAAGMSLDEQEYSVRQEIANDAALLTGLAAEVATLNGQISRALATGHQPNDLLDARDEIIRKLNRYVQVSTVPTDFGQVSLFIGGSQPLVLGTSSAQLRVDLSRDYPGSGRQSLYFSMGDGSADVELTAQVVGGGSVGGLLKFANEDLMEGRNLLGRLAMVISQEMNLQNSRGLNLRGQPGADLFSLEVKNIPGYSNFPDYNTVNAPTATVSLNATATTNVDGQDVPNAWLLKPSDYRISFDHTAGQTAVIITRLTDGTQHRHNVALPQPATVTDATQITVDGLTFTLPKATLDAAFTADAPILFQPFATAAKEMNALLHNPDELAAASILTANISTSNQGQLQLTGLGMTRTGNPDTAQAGADTAHGIPAPGEPFALVFDGNGGYRYGRITDAATRPPTLDGGGVAVASGYVPGKEMRINGWSITLTGTPAAGDFVTVGRSRDLGEGYRLNAGNAAAFLALRDLHTFDGGTAFSDGFSAAMATAGARTQSAKYAADFSETVARSLAADRSAISGVDKDEEAARLLQYQQAYQASAKVIQTAQALFDSLLAAVGGR